MFDAQHVGILALALVIDTEPHTATDLLTLLHLVAGVLQRAYLEHVGVVPAFFERRVREDEAHGAIPAQQFLLILHNEVETAFLILALIGPGVNAVTFLVDGEIAVVYVVGRVLRIAQETDVPDISERGSKLLQHPVVFLFEHFRKLPFPAVALVVKAVTVHVVDEKQRQYLDSQREELALALQMRPDGLAYLVTAHDVVIGCARHISLVKGQPVEKMDGVRKAVDALYEVVVLILVKSAALCAEVVPLAQHLHHLSCVRGRLTVEADACHRAAL